MSFKNRLKIVFLTSILSIKAFAFDPVSIATGIQAASGIMNGIEKAEEAADVGFAIGDLFDELGEAHDENEKLKKAISNLEGLKSHVSEFRDGEENLRQAVEFDLKDATSLSQQIRSVRKIISSTKKVAQILGLRPKAAERAARVQEMRINSKILDELQALRRDQMLTYLENKEYRTRREMYLNQILQSSRRRGL